MPRRRKVAAKPIVKEIGRCRVREVVEAIMHQIGTGWMTEKDFDIIYEQVKEKIKENKNAKI